MPPSEPSLANGEAAARRLSGTTATGAAALRSKVRTSETHPLNVSWLFTDEAMDHPPPDPLAVDLAAYNGRRPSSSTPPLPAPSSADTRPQPKRANYTTVLSEEWAAEHPGVPAVDLFDVIAKSISLRVHPSNPPPPRPSEICRVYPPAPGAVGNIGISSCPGKKVRLDEQSTIAAAAGTGRQPVCRELGHDMPRLAGLGIKLIVCCLYDEEMASVGAPWPEYSAAATAAGIEVVRIPMIDGKVPPDRRVLSRTLEAMHARLESGANVLVHCRGGIGRAALVACCYLLRYGWIRTDRRAIGLLRMRRSPRAIETPMQEEYIHAYFRDMQCRLRWVTQWRRNPASVPPIDVHGEGRIRTVDDDIDGWMFPLPPDATEAEKRGARESMGSSGFGIEFMVGSASLAEPTTAMSSGMMKPASRPSRSDLMQDDLAPPPTKTERSLSLPVNNKSSVRRASDITIPTTVTSSADSADDLAAPRALSGSTIAVGSDLLGTPPTSSKSRRLSSPLARFGSSLSDQGTGGGSRNSVAFASPGVERATTPRSVRTQQINPANFWYSVPSPTSSRSSPSNSMPSSRRTSTSQSGTGSGAHSPKMPGSPAMTPRGVGEGAEARPMPRPAIKRPADSGVVELSSGGGDS
ncbi:hypothetical protein H9P43_002061 [Blastocladiella emersonii ATCC 22665]|nr:hypothetical protein H9P43_002061 [Blastocladiella emersonii ATCC 22665]